MPAPAYQTLLPLVALIVVAVLAAARGCDGDRRWRDAPWKLGHNPGGGPERAFVRAAVWERGTTTWPGAKGGTPARLSIGAGRGGVSLLLDLARGRAQRWWVLYVLTTPRGDHALGRYESGVHDWPDVEAFFRRFADFLEGDGRHQVWLASEDETCLLVFEQHDILYAYGDLDGYERLLRERGFRPGEVAIPVPHFHHYRDLFDPDEDAVLGWWDWRRSDLREADDPGRTDGVR